MRTVNFRASGAWRRTSSPNASLPPGPCDLDQLSFVSVSKLCKAAHTE